MYFKRKFREHPYGFHLIRAFIWIILTVPGQYFYSKNGGNNIEEIIIFAMMKLI